jgi:hypothetical protein
MNTIVASSKSAVRFTLNFFDKTITGTKASFNKANKGFGPEYEELTSKMAAHPDFTLVVKEQKTKTTKAKRTYEGMDYKFMEGQADPMSEAFLQMAGVFSQLELAMIRARVRSGMENARAKGRQIGRPQVSKEDIPAPFLRHYPAYKSKQLNVSELARVCHISRTTVYKYIRLLEG